MFHHATYFLASTAPTPPSRSMERRTLHRHWVVGDTWLVVLDRLEVMPCLLEHVDVTQGALEVGGGGGARRRGDLAHELLAFEGNARRLEFYAFQAANEGREVEGIHDNNGSLIIGPHFIRDTPGSRETM